MFAFDPRTTQLVYPDPLSPISPLSVMPSMLGERAVAIGAAARAAAVYP